MMPPVTLPPEDPPASSTAGVPDRQDQSPKFCDSEPSTTDEVPPGLHAARSSYLYSCGVSLSCKQRESNIGRVIEEHATRQITLRAWASMQ